MSHLVLQFNTTSNTWVPVGNMTNGRASHAISIVPEEDAIDYCIRNI